LLLALLVLGCRGQGQRPVPCQPLRAEHGQPHLLGRLFQCKEVAASIDPRTHSNQRPRREDLQVSQLRWLQLLVFPLRHLDVLPRCARQARCVLAPQDRGAVFVGNVHVLTRLHWTRPRSRARSSAGWRSSPCIRRQSQTARAASRRKPRRARLPGTWRRRARTHCRKPRD
jgi:hypothetical protein